MYFAIHIWMKGHEANLTLPISYQLESTSAK